MKEYKPALAAIDPISIYKNKNGKININWYIYELSLAIYDNIVDEMNNELTRKNVESNQLSLFSVAVAANLAKDMCETPINEIDSDKSENYLFAIFKKHLGALNTNKITAKIEKQIIKSIEDINIACKSCAVNCLGNPQIKNYKFNEIINSAQQAGGADK